MANIAQSVNVISTLMTTKEGIVKQTTWWPLLLFCRYMDGWTIGSHIACAAYEGETQPKWLQTVKDTPWLDVSATVDEEGWVGGSVVNLHEEKTWEARIEDIPSEVQVYTVTGDSVNVTNMEGKENVGIKESKWDGKGDFSFPKHSFTLLRWKM